MEKNVSYIVAAEDTDSFGEYVDTIPSFAEKYGFVLEGNTAKTATVFASETFFDDIVDHVIRVWYFMYVISAKKVR